MPMTGDTDPAVAAASFVGSGVRQRLDYSIAFVHQHAKVFEET
jgi:hypothetical protein